MITTRASVASARAVFRSRFENENITAGEPILQSCRSTMQSATSLQSQSPTTDQIVPANGTASAKPLARVPAKGTSAGLTTALGRATSTGQNWDKHVSDLLATQDGISFKEFKAVLTGSNGKLTLQPMSVVH